MIDLFRNTEVLTLFRAEKVKDKHEIFVGSHALFYYYDNNPVVRHAKNNHVFQYEVSKRNLDLSNLRQNWMSNYFFVYSCMYQDQLSNYVLQKIRLGSEFDNIIFCLRC